MTRWLSLPVAAARSRLTRCITTWSPSRVGLASGLLGLLYELRADTHFPISGVAVPIPLSPPMYPDPPLAASGLSRPWSGARVQRSRKLLHRARKGREGERTSRMTPPNTAPLRVPPRVCSSLETMYSVKRKRTIKVFKAVRGPIFAKPIQSSDSSIRGYISDT